jgi:hypothetical protein
MTGGHIRGVEVHPHSFLNSVVGGKWPDSGPGCFIPRKKSLVTIEYNTGWGSWAGLKVLENRKILTSR